MTPEEPARQEIDRQLEQCGWQVQNRDEMNISARARRRGPRVPARPARPTTCSTPTAGPSASSRPSRRAHADRRRNAIRQIHGGLPAGLPHYALAAALRLRITGAVTQFTNILEPDARSREVFTFHRPEELIRLAKLDAQVRGSCRHCRRSTRSSSGASRSRPSRTWKSRSPATAPGR